MSDTSWKNLTDKNLEDAGFKPVHEKKDDGGEVLASVNVGTLSGGIALRTKVDDNKLYVAFNEEPEWLWIVVEPTVEALKKIYDRYAKPTITAADAGFPFGENAIARTIVLREAEGRVGLGGEGVKTIKWFIGYADYDDYMVSLENSLVFNNWLNQNMIRMATANGGNWSQWSALYSRSLITIMRWVPPQGQEHSSFTVEVQYFPVEPTESVQKGLAGHSNDERSGLHNKVPEDMPVDVVGFLFDAKFELLWGKKELLKWIKGGEDAYVQHLPVVISDDDFEDTYMQLADHPTQKLRDFIAREVIWRGSKKAYEAIKKHGVSDDVVELAKEHKLEG